MRSNKHVSGEIWIDLTDMLVWQGSFTGIQQVTYAYAQRFSKDGARFLAYDKVDNRFVEVNFNILQADNVVNDDRPEVVLLRRRLRRVVGKPYYVLPDNYKDSLRPTVSLVNHVTRYVLGRIIPAAPEIVSQYGHLPVVNFNKGDTVVLIGAGWNEGSILQKLCEIKQVTAIRISQHINDMLPIYQPQLFTDELSETFTFYVRMVAKHADLITVISEATKRDLLIFYKESKLSAPRIEVVRLGDDSKSNKTKKPMSVGEHEQFILSVGTFEIRKNYILLYQAVKLGQMERRELPKIVIAGRKGWLTDDLAHILSRDPFVKENIVWLDDVKDEELCWLYENCMFTVFPSLAEGWGLPVVESLRHGKLCLASGVSSMLEIGDGLVDYFLPYDARECLEKIHYYIAENRYRENNIAIKKHYKPYTWNESYKRFKSSVLQ